MIPVDGEKLPLKQEMTLNQIQFLQILIMPEFLLSMELEELVKAG